jgi:hypothetical protein
MTLLTARMRLQMELLETASGQVVQSCEARDRGLRLPTSVRTVGHPPPLALSLSRMRPSSIVSWPFAMYRRAMDGIPDSRLVKPKQRGIMAIFQPLLRSRTGLADLGNSQSVHTNRLWEGVE